MDQIGKPLLAGIIAYAGAQTANRGFNLDLGLIDLSGSTGLAVVVGASEFLTETYSDVILPKLFNAGTIADFKMFLNPALTGLTALAYDKATGPDGDYVIPFLLGAIPAAITNVSYETLNSYIPK